MPGSNGSGRGRRAVIVRGSDAEAGRSSAGRR